MTTMTESGSLSPRYFAVDSATQVECGDLVFLATDDVRPADQLAWDTNLATTQENFHDVFVGLVMQRSRFGDVAEVRVVKDGVWEFDCDPDQFEIGEYIGVADSGSSTLVNNKVVKVASENLAIGRVSKRYTSDTSRVRVRIFTAN